MGKMPKPLSDDNKLLNKKEKDPTGPTIIFMIAIVEAIGSSKSTKAGSSLHDVDSVIKLLRFVFPFTTFSEKTIPVIYSDCVSKNKEDKQIKSRPTRDIRKQHFIVSNEILSKPVSKPVNIDTPTLNQSETKPTSHSDLKLKEVIFTRQLYLEYIEALNKLQSDDNATNRTPFTAYPARTVKIFKSGNNIDFEYSNPNLGVPDLDKIINKFVKPITSGNIEIAPSYYCDYDVGLKIFSNLELQPGSFLGQNDPHEFFFALGKLIGQSSLIDSFRGDAKNWESVGSNFMISLTENSDNLTMWKGYSKNGYGYALTFNVFSDNIYKIKYLSTDSRSENEEGFAEVLVSIQDLLVAGDIQNLRSFGERYFKLLGTIKSSFYTDEKEYRFFFEKADTKYHNVSVRPNSQLRRIYLRAFVGLASSAVQHNSDYYRLTGIDSSVLNYDNQLRLAKVTLGPKMNETHIYEVRDALRNNLIVTTLKSKITKLKKELKGLSWYSSDFKIAKQQDLVKTYETALNSYIEAVNNLPIELSKGAYR